MAAFCGSARHHLDHMLSVGLLGWASPMGQGSWAARCWILATRRLPMCLSHTSPCQPGPPADQVGSQPLSGAHCSETLAQR